jgi:hypothetical protein
VRGEERLIEVTARAYTNPPYGGRPFMGALSKRIIVPLLLILPINRLSNATIFLTLRTDQGGDMERLARHLQRMRRHGHVGEVRWPQRFSSVSGLRHTRED